MQAVFLGPKGDKVDGQVLGEHIGREHTGKLQEYRHPGGVVVAARTFLDGVVVCPDQQHPRTQSGTLGDHIGCNPLDNLRPDRHPYRHGTTRCLLNKVLARSTIESQHRHGHQLTETPAERPGTVVIDHHRARPGLGRRQGFVAEPNPAAAADEGNPALESPIRYVLGATDAGTNQPTFHLTSRRILHRDASDARTIRKQHQFAAVVIKIGVLEELLMDFVAVGVKLIGDVFRRQLCPFLPGNARANLARQGHDVLHRPLGGEYRCGPRRQRWLRGCRRGDGSGVRRR